MKIWSKHSLYKIMYIHIFDRGLFVFTRLDDGRRWLPRDAENTYQNHRTVVVVVVADTTHRRPVSSYVSRVCLCDRVCTYAHAHTHIHMCESGRKRDAEEGGRNKVETHKTLLTHSGNHCVCVCVCVRFARKQCPDALRDNGCDSDTLLNICNAHEQWPATVKWAL